MLSLARNVSEACAYSLVGDVPFKFQSPSLRMLGLAE